MAKKMFIQLILGSLFFLFTLTSKAQVTAPINTSANPAQYVGMLNQPFPLLIAHKGTQGIDFATGGTQRMTILGTSSGATAGFVGTYNI